MENKAEKQNTDEDDENYNFTTPVSRRLSQILNIPEFPYDETFSWEPPSTPGLQNCNIIIEPYYHLHKSPHKITSIDYLQIIKDDIRNFRQLNKYKMDYIQGISDKEKNELLILFNECIASISNLIDT